MINALRVLFEGETALDFSGLITALTGAVSAQQIITYMAAVVGAGLGIYVAYVFGRKAVRAFGRAIKGKAPTM